jgi:type IV secretion system protein VirD4
MREMPKAPGKMQQHSILIGRDGKDHLYFDGTEHVALYAKTGSGKTSSAVIPNCLTWPGSLVVLDIKGEAFAASAGYRSRVLKQDIFVFNPAAQDQRTHCWNSLGTVDRTSMDRFDQISRQSFMLFPENTGAASSNADTFWTPAGRQAFVAVASLIAETPDQPMTIANILRVFLRGDDGVRWLSRQIDERRQAGKPYSQTVVDSVADYVTGDPRQTDGIRKTVTTRLQVWQNPRVAAATSASDFDLRDIRRRPMTIYVTVEPGNLPRMRPLLALFFDALVNLNSDTLPEKDPTIKHQALVILDEFARLGRMESLAEAAQYLRGYGLRLFYIIQNKAQLRAKYGPDAAEDVFDNTGAEIVFGTNDLRLTKELSERMGDDTVNVTTLNRPRWMAWLKLDRQSEAEHPHRRPLMLAQEVARMSPSEQIILRAGMPPMKTERATWFTDPGFQRLVQPAPEIPLLPVSLEMDDGQTSVKPGAAQHGAAAAPAPPPVPAVAAEDDFDADDPFGTC